MRAPRSAYEAAGVSIDAGEEAVARIRAAVKKTVTPGVIGGLGGFGGLFAMPKGLKEPVLVASTDGVGTKLRVANLVGRHDSVGQDLVNHCVNDIAVQGAVPLFFLDYFATGHLEPEVMATVVTGMAKACHENGCALIGGETAEMPGFYAAGDYDVAGFIVGVVERSRVLTGDKIRPGDAVLGWASTGLHSNGYSLARAVLFDKAKLLPKSYLPELEGTVGDALLAVHRSYGPTIHSLRKRYDIRGLAHLTGGGFWQNIPRILPANVSVELLAGSWEVPPIFRLIEEWGGISDEEMHRVFNMGVGMVVIVPDAQSDAVLTASRKLGETAWRIGRVAERRRNQPPVRFADFL